MQRMRLVCSLILVGLLGLWFVRAVGDAREAARRAQCVGNLKWAAIALLNYQSANGSFPPGTVPNPALPPERRLGWAVECWSWLSGGSTHLKVDRSKAWDEPPNWPPKIVAAENVT